MLGIRWMIGDVSRRGFESLRLSTWGAWGLFGADADYLVCVNTVSADHARQLVGSVPDAVRWQAADSHLPGWLRTRFLDDGLAEGVAWKLAPLRCFPDRRELSLDNDVILWELPAALAAWLADESPERCLLAEDVVPSVGQFVSVCKRRALSTGCGAHFVGLNARRFGWDFDGAPAERVRARHWDQHRAELYQRVGIEPEPSELSMRGG